MKIPAALVLLPFFSATAGAHHSRAEFSPEVEELRGQLVEVRWINPHAGLMLKVIEVDGDEQLWRVETFNGPRALARFGVTAELFSPGEALTIAGRKSTFRPNYFLGTNVLLADGTEVLIGEDGQRWPQRVVIGSGLTGTQAVSEEKLRAAAQENKGIFRVWSVSDRTTIETFPFTDAAIAARANWDPAAEPIARCEQPGMPVTMRSITPIEFVDEGDTIVLRAQYFDTIRRIHLNQSEADRARTAASSLGNSVGHWEGGTLVVVTTKISYPRFDTSGTPQSADVMILEKFTPSEDQSRLEFQMTITDPSTFRESATFGRYYLALGQSLERFDCNVF
jgi:hypothetical protein